MARLDIVISRVGMRPLTKNPVDLNGNPAQVEGNLQAELVDAVDVNGNPTTPTTPTVLPGDAASNGEPYLVSTNNVGDVLHFKVKADADVNPGVEAFIEDDVFATVVEAQAVSSGLGVGAEVPKP